MAHMLFLLSLQCILLFSERLAKDGVVFIVIWIGAIMAAVLSGLSLGKTMWSADRVLKKMDVLVNLSATVAFFMSLQYLSLQGFIISKVACQVLLGLYEHQISKRIALMYIMPLAALLLQIHTDGLNLFIGCAFSYLAFLSEQRLDDPSTSYTKFYANALLSVIAMPLANAELTHNSWSTKSTTISILITATFYVLYNWKNKRVMNKNYEVMGLAVLGLAMMVYNNTMDLLTLAALVLVVIGRVLAQRVKSSAEDSSQILNVDPVNKNSGHVLAALSVLVVVGATIMYAQGIPASAMLGPVQLSLLSIDSNYNVPYNASVIPVTQAEDAKRLQCLFNARKLITERMAKLIAGTEALSLMDVPLHWNLGDSFIWHGDNLFMNMQSIPIVTPRDPEQREMDTLHSYAKNVTVLLHGGGNFGDWWRENADFRLKVLNETSNRVIFLPQSISYREDKYALIDRTAFEKHGKLTLLLRDTPSLKFARETFPNTESLFVPDMAFMIGPLAPAADPMFDILFLLRSDTERVLNDTDLALAKHIANSKELSYEIWDFPVDGYPIPKTVHENRPATYDYRMLYPNLRAEDITKDILPIFRVAMGNKLLSRGSVIVTDRLHASIMGVLIGRPVVYVDNAYKKLSNIWSSMATYVPECKGDNVRAQHADTLDQAVEMAYELIRDTRK